MTDEQFQNISNKLDALHGDFREFKGGQEARVAELEDKLKTASLWENIKVIGVMPIMALAHHFWGGK